MPKRIVLERLIQNGVEILTQAKAVAVQDNTVVFDRVGVIDRVEGVDSVVVAVGTDPQEVGVHNLDKMEIPIRRIGDCLVPRSAFEAMQEGFIAGVEI